MTHRGLADAKSRIAICSHWLFKQHLTIPDHS